MSGIFSLDLVSINTVSILARLGLSVICGGIIGLERVKGTSRRLQNPYSGLYGFCLGHHDQSVYCGNLRRF